MTYNKKYSLGIYYKISIASYGYFHLANNKFANKVFTEINRTEKSNNYL